ncbi:hypothetical protein D3C74_236830 [compost metagenome]
MCFLHNAITRNKTKKEYLALCELFDSNHPPHARTYINGELEFDRREHFLLYYFLNRRLAFFEGFQQSSTGALSHTTHVPFGAFGTVGAWMASHPYRLPLRFLAMHRSEASLRVWLGRKWSSPKRDNPRYTDPPA